MVHDQCLCTDDCAVGFNPHCSCACGDCDCANIANMIGKKRARVFHDISDYISSHYALVGVWKRLKVKTKKWKYEYKFSKGGKTLCGFYLTDDCLGFMVVLGQKERDRIEDGKAEYSEAFLSLYEAAETYHDGKWLMVEMDGAKFLKDLTKVLSVKRKPTITNRKIPHRA